MLFFLSAAALLLHTLFWGVGLALLIVPRPWSRYWPVFMPVCGLTLQSTVVWLGIYTAWPGTAAYAAWSEIIPTGLLAAGIYQRRASFRAELLRFRSLGLLMVVLLVALVHPFAQASAELTTSSMGSCDAADYAAGARVLQEFSRQDRSGFMGLKEVVQLESVDNFFDHWIRLNHFAPSALIAHHAAIFHRRPYELISVFTAGLLVLSLPIVFWLARSTLRHRSRAAFFVALLYGVSPLMLYAVYHVAIGQLLAGQAIALLTWAGCAAARPGCGGRSIRGLGALLLVGYALILASYHFIVIVCALPAVAYVAARALAQRDWRGFARWSRVMIVPLLLATALYWERVLGLRERFLLFQRIDFGWKIPALTPEGWLGIVASQSLGAHAIWLRAVLCIALAGFGGWIFWRNPTGRRPWRTISVCLPAPILIGYAFLEWRGAVKGTNASYDAYKLFSVFYPGLLASFALWLRPLQALAPWRVRLPIYALGAVVVAGNLFADASMWERMRAPHLIVNRELRDLRLLEQQPGIDSVNVLTGDVWSRLWANAMLLRKAQYFSKDTFEGRRATSLKGRYDLVGRVCRFERRSVKPGDNLVRPFFTLIDTRAPDFLRVEAAEGWNDQECDYVTLRRTRWTRGNATVFIDNPNPRPLRVSAQFRASAITERDVEIVLGTHVLLRSRTGGRAQDWDVGEFEIAPGRNTLVIRSSQPGLVLPGKDRRQRGFMVHDFCVRMIAPVGVPDASDLTQNF